MAPFPGGKRFAFSVFDDTDGGTVENLAPVYALLGELGIRVTKSVWPLPGARGSSAGQTLADPQYRRFALGLREAGHELGLHGVRDGHSPRDVVREGLARFEEVAGGPPRVHCNHSVNRDNLYWGPERLRGRATRLAYNAATRWRRAGGSLGHCEGSEYFWGDLCRERVSYVRNFVFDEIDLLRVNPTLPYRDPSTPFVPWWFSSSEGGTADSFCRMIRPENQDRLEQGGGVCIMYTHFAAGFAANGSVRPDFAERMRRLARRDGWFPPVAELLDWLRESRGAGEVPARERARMERRWLLSKLRRGTT
jgi:hypothetical protein